MNKEIKQLIDDLAMEVLNMCEIKSDAVDIKQLVKKLGGKVNEMDFQNVKTMLEKNHDNKFIINVYKDMNEKTKRYYIAYALGHLLLHSNFLIDHNSYLKEDKISLRREDYFACCQNMYFALSVLMPKNRYKNIVNINTNGNIVDTKSVAKYFDVTTSMASERGKSLRLLKD